MFKVNSWIEEYLFAVTDKNNAILFTFRNSIPK
jgi:hypothetical protein